MHSNEKPLVSVVTPVYNTEKYLAECIESVLAQTYQNWEYVIINNCSTDQSPDIIQHYAQKDSRIKVYNNDKLLDVMQNWNHAMRQISAKSKYCKVVHADDWLFPECISRMVAVAEANPSIGIVGSYRLDENWVNLDGLPYPSTVVRGREVCRLHLLRDSRYFLFGSPTSLLYDADLIRSRKDFFSESNIHADKEACFSVLQNNDFGYVHQVLTYTRRHNETETSFARRFNTYIIGDLTILLKYGRVFLNKQEYEKAIEELLKRYYRILGRSIIKSRGKEFLEYHKKEMEKLGYPIYLPRLYKSSFTFLFNRLLDRMKIK